MLFSKNKKGYQIKDIAPIVIMIGIAIVAMGIMTQVTDSVAAGNCKNSTYVWNSSVGLCVNASDGQHYSGAGESYATNISIDGMAGLSEFGSWFDTIGLVLAAAIIIGILVYAFAFRK